MTTTITAPLKGDTSLRTAVELLTRLTPLQLADAVDNINYYMDEDTYGPTRAFQKHGCVDMPELRDEDVYLWVYQLLFSGCTDRLDELKDEGQITVSDETTALITQLEELYETKRQEGRLLQVVERLNRMTETDRQFVLSRVS
ncbi:hypothetical protein [Synechococcus sp. WH 8016]|uniref:hypothetical protein n=1 Tax=Synechococcus sp. WH 8016 TaxID=166318 RepID=UPI00022D7D7C|nr:hypothetical protein [Synechococcus sp. WH 8016]EHA63776.1 hypothetical protein Syn8016DRAFT_0817 [Synechococcus sp. WH 8016]